MSPDDLATALSASIDATLAQQLIDESVSLEEAFLLKKWKYTELDGGRFAEVAARIVYAVDSGNVSLTKSVDDCLKYIDNQQVPHYFPEPQGAIHLSKVMRAIYKLRSQRGAVHVSATYTANEIDSRLVIECARWVFAEVLRIFVVSDREKVADIVRKLARFPQPLIRTIENVPLLQSISFTAEEEILAHLHNCGGGMSVTELVAVIPKDGSGVRRAATKLTSGQVRQAVMRDGRLHITDLGITRIEEKIARDTVMR
jgi:hypothetical protein